jgi:DNA polymerase-1
MQVFLDKYSRDMLGRIRWFSLDQVEAKDINKIGSHMKRAGRNHVIQGTSASMTKTAIVYIYNAIKPYKAKLVNTVHDEIVVESAAVDAGKIEEIIQDCMRKAGERFLKKVPVLIETKVSDSWA